MIQRIIDWYNGYTLEDKLELEWLLETAKEKAIEELNNIDVKELQKRDCAFDINVKGKNKNIDKDLLNGDYTMEVKMLVVNIENMDFTPNYIIRQIKLMKLKGSTIRVRINIDTIGGEKFQYCREYELSYIKELLMIKFLSNKEDCRSKNK
jgi:hypothetical protein